MFVGGVKRFETKSVIEHREEILLEFSCLN